MSAAHVIAARDLRFAYRGGQDVLCGAGLRAPAGRLVCVLGPNGSGKTTLLRCLLGRLRPRSGEIMLDGAPLASHAPRAVARLMAYVPQFPRAAFSFTARELVRMGRFAHTGLLGMAGRQDREVTRLAMEMTATGHLADRTLDELSGGEAQCVMIARALAQQPAVILLDEPTSHLDIRNQLAIYRMMQRLAGDWGMAVVCVSHDVNLAARFADELVLMREGRVVAAGPPREVIRRDVLGETYAVEVDLVETPDATVPLVRAR
ncbi:MAG: ABC transporter ATP-binding protein [Planctomycetota bacterium]